MTAQPANGNVTQAKVETLETEVAKLREDGGRRWAKLADHDAKLATVGAQLGALTGQVGDLRGELRESRTEEREFREEVHDNLHEIRDSLAVCQNKRPCMGGGNAPAGAQPGAAKSVALPLWLVLCLFGILLAAIAPDAFSAAVETFRAVTAGQ